MRLPAVRRRFVWPADDLVTLSTSVDGAVDHGLARLRGSRPALSIGDHDPSASVAVLGFPRSANTLLTSWLTMVARPGVTVLDGRGSHSSLDLHRVAQTGMPVVVPVRRPVDACASMMVRKSLHASSSYGRAILRSYTAWHTVAGRALDHDSVTVATFAEITSNPSSIVNGTRLEDLVDPDAVARLDMESLLERTRSSLETVVGQGLPEGGIPARMMISLPEPARADELEQARALLRSRALSEARLHAEFAHEEFVSAAELAQPAHFAPLGYGLDSRASTATM